MQQSEYIAMMQGPPEYFQAITFRTETPAGTLSYHAAFDATS